MVPITESMTGRAFKTLRYIANNIVGDGNAIGEFELRYINEGLVEYEENRAYIMQFE